MYRYNNGKREYYTNFDVVEGYSFGNMLMDNKDDKKKMGMKEYVAIAIGAVLLIGLVGYGIYHLKKSKKKSK